MIHAILTIDDIPSGNTQAIVDYLMEKGIRAVMFAVGEWIRQNPEPAVYALQHGMIVGNHSNSHPAFSKLSLEEEIQEIERCEDELNRLYDAASVERKFKPFRFPYGDKGGSNKEALQRYLREHGFSKLDDRQIDFSWWKKAGLNREIDTLWTFDFAEYRIRPDSGFTEEDVWKRIRDPEPENGAALMKEGSHHILLMHAHDETDEMVSGYYRLFIDYLLDHGVVFDSPAFLT